MTPAHILQHHDQGCLWPTDQLTALDSIAQAYQTALQVRALRVARGEIPRGFKIGFTNPSIWLRYNVSAPVWGTVYNTTLAFCDTGGDEGVGVGRESAATLSLAGRAQPRIEPEAVFGMLATPPPNASLAQLWACIDWVAPGFEIVQSHAPGWKFTAPLAVADGALHSHLVVGRKVAVNPLAPSAAAFNDLLAGCSMALHKDAAVVEQGQGRNVMQGPLLALAHFLTELRQCSGAPDLQAGDVITTGTWTDAWPVQPGDVWQAQFQAPLSSLTLTFT